MVESIRKPGILGPIILWQHEDRHIILSGHNRVNAAKLAGLTRGPEVIKENLDYADAVLIVTETNCHQCGNMGDAGGNQAVPERLGHDKAWIIDGGIKKFGRRNIKISADVKECAHRGKISAGGYCLDISLAVL